LSDDGSVQQQLGLLHGRFEGISKRVDRLQEDMSDQNVKLDRILEGINKYKGAIWILSSVATLAASLGAGLHALIQYWAKGGPP
jgi:hypothetical protein